MGHLAADQFCGRLRRASRCGDPRQGTELDSRDEDLVVFTPYRAPRKRGITKCHGGAALHGDLFHSAVGEEPDPLTTGREERILGTLGAGQYNRLILSQQPGGEPLLSVMSAHRIDKSAAVR